MRLIVLLSIAVFACGGEQETNTTEPEETEETESETPAPLTDISVVASRIGGTRLIAGNYIVELLPGASGDVKAVVTKPDGTEVSDAKMNVTVQAKGGGTAEVALDWDATSNSYVGRVDQGIASGTVSIGVEVDDVEATGSVETMTVAPDPVYGGHVVVLGDISAEVRPQTEGAIIATVARMDEALGADAGIELEVGLKGSDGNDYQVPLAWDAEASAHVGVLPPDVEIAPGALALRTEIDGHLREAILPQIGFRAPEYDGEVVAVEDMTVELVGDVDGALRAYPHDVEGAAVPEAELVIGVGGEQTELDWDEDASCYVGSLPAAVDISAVPLDVRVRANGRWRRGGIAAAASPSLRARWGTRIEAGAGGALRPGQPTVLAPSADLRGRANVRGRVAAPGQAVRVSAMAGLRSASVMARNQARRAEMVAVEARGKLGNAAANARRNAEAVRSTMVRPRNVMVSAGASASGMASGMSAGSMRTGMGGASAMASFMVGF